jgi:outer membrane protein assembly factor BamB
MLLVGVRVGLAESYDWPQWQGPQRNGLTDEKGLLQQWPDGGPQRKWLFEKCGAGYGGPAVVNGGLFILGARDGVCQLIALNVNTGQEVWATPLSPEFQNDWGNGPRGTPTVDEGRVYALSASGTLICVRAKDGRELWRTTMESLGGRVPNWGYTESILIDGNKLLCTPGGPRGAIAALDKGTGQVIWQSEELTDFAHYSSIVRGEIHGRPQYVQLLEKRLVGLSTEDGRLLWEVDWPGNVAVIPTPIINYNHVFVTSGYGAGCKLVAISAQNEATTVYENKLMKNQHGGVIRVGDYVYGFSDDVGWLCLDFRSGERKWRDRDALGKGAIGYADEKLYCVDQAEGQVVLIDASPEGWSERGRFTLSPQSSKRSPRGGIWVHPVIVDGKLLLRDQELVYCFDVKE